jgi:hypothetical protein
MELKNTPTHTRRRGSQEGDPKRKKQVRYSLMIQIFSLYCLEIHAELKNPTGKPKRKEFLI